MNGPQPVLESRSRVDLNILDRTYDIHQEQVFPMERSFHQRNVFNVNRIEFAL